jgi:DNA repair exonuclease SbcCD nuclease subunit
MKDMIPTIKRSKVAIISDLHLGVHSNSAEWHNHAIEWAHWFREECRSNNIEDIIFCGDWHHNRSEISVNTLQISADILDMLAEFNFIAIVGNHDIYYKHRTDVNSLSIFKNRKNVTVLDRYQNIEAFDRIISFCPWNTNVIEIENSDIIFGHFEIETFSMNSFKVCEEGIKIKDLLSKSNLVISGHFHTRHEKRFGSGTILYVGNPFQMDFGDAGNTKGYHILDIETLDFEFKANTISPQYVKIALSELVKEGNITTRVKGLIGSNIIKLKVDMNISQEDMDILMRVLTKLKPESLTVDYDINFNRILESTEQREDLSGVDIECAIEEFINLLEVEDKKDIIDYTLSLYERNKL